MEVLDNPVWHALCTGNKRLALGNSEVRYFEPAASPFVALKEETEENFRALAGMLTHGNPSLFFSTKELDFPSPWKILRAIPGYQMVHNRNIIEGVDVSGLTMLATQDVPQMLELTQLTKPGPFSIRTIEFGHYAGVFEGGRLVAMAGQRFLPTPYAEISAVCTHPEHTGKGYARQLLTWQVNRIIAEGNIPMLHVAGDNARAIKVYQSLGFAIRISVWFYLITA